MKQHSSNDEGYIENNYEYVIRNAGIHLVRSGQTELLHIESDGELHGKISIFDTAALSQISFPIMEIATNNKLPLWIHHEIYCRDGLTIVTTEGGNHIKIKSILADMDRTCIQNI